MAKTSMYSLIGILIIILVLFRSIKYGFTPMSTIIFGTIWQWDLLVYRDGYEFTDIPEYYL